VVLFFFLFFSFFSSFLLFHQYAPCSPLAGSVFESVHKDRNRVSGPSASSSSSTSHGHGRWIDLAERMQVDGGRPARTHARDWREHAGWRSPRRRRRRSCRPDMCVHTIDTYVFYVCVCGAPSEACRMQSAVSAGCGQRRPGDSSATQLSSGRPVDEHRADPALRAPHGFPTAQGSGERRRTGVVEISQAVRTFSVLMSSHASMNKQIFWRAPLQLASLVRAGFRSRRRAAVPLPPSLPPIAACRLVATLAMRITTATHQKLRPARSADRLRRPTRALSISRQLLQRAGSEGAARRGTPQRNVTRGNERRTEGG